MLGRLINMFLVADLRGKVLFTIVIIAAFRLGCHIPLPYVDFSALDVVGVVVPSGTTSDRGVIEADGSVG